MSVCSDRSKARAQWIVGNGRGNIRILALAGAEDGTPGRVCICIRAAGSGCHTGTARRRGSCGHPSIRGTKHGAAQDKANSCLLIGIRTWVGRPVLCVRVCRSVGWSSIGTLDTWTGHPCGSDCSQNAVAGIGHRVIRKLPRTAGERSEWRAHTAPADRPGARVISVARESACTIEPACVMLAGT